MLLLVTKLDGFKPRAWKTHKLAVGPFFCLVRSATYRNRECTRRIQATAAAFSLWEAREEKRLDGKNDYGSVSDYPKKKKERKKHALSQKVSRNCMRNLRLAYYCVCRRNLRFDPTPEQY